MLGYAYAGQDEMLLLSRGIEINESAKAKAATNLQTGERTLEYVTEHKDGNGGKISVPGLFLIAIPVFKDGVVYRLPVYPAEGRPHAAKFRTFGNLRARARPTTGHIQTRSGETGPGARHADR
jgi:hypothetical protein